MATDQRRRAAAQSRESKDSDRRAWTLLFYLCGDHTPFSTRIHRNLKGIEQAVSSKNVHIAVQYDVPRGAQRFLVANGDGRQHVRDLGRLNTGDPATALDFFKWALERCPSERLALVLAGTGIGEPKAIVGDVESGDYQRLFTFCDDSSDRDALSPVELREILEEVVEWRNGKSVDMVAFDMCSMQYLEVAYQLDGLVDVVVGSQGNERAPEWPYKEIVTAWCEACDEDASDAKHLGGRMMGSLVVDAIGREFARRKKYSRAIVTALDLSQLDLITRSLDTMFLALLRSLGNEAVWEARERCFAQFTKQHREAVKDDPVLARREASAYDVRQLLWLFETALREVSKTSSLLFWLTNWIKKRDQVRVVLTSLTEQEAKKLESELEQLQQFREEKRQLLAEQQRVAQQAEASGSEGDDEQVALMMEVLTELDEEIRGISERLRARSARNRDLEEQQLRASFSHLFEEWLPVARKAASIKGPNRKRELTACFSRWLPAAHQANGKHTADDACSDSRLDEVMRQWLLETTERAGDDALAACESMTGKLERMAIDYAGVVQSQHRTLHQDMEATEHLRAVVSEVRKLVEPPCIQQTSDDDGEEPNSRAFVFAQAPAPVMPPDPDSPAYREQLETLRSGVLIYRPQNLARLSGSRYLDLDFHRRVHWLPLLAAINLISEHPNALWKLISSLMATASGTGRDDLLRRLVGPESVMADFGEQFRTLQKPPCVTLSMEEEVPGLSPDDSDGRLQDECERQYTLRLESSRKGGTVIEQKSVVNRRTLANALAGLEELLRRTRIERKDVARLESLGRTLGEDVIQKLGRNLDEEWAEFSDSDLDEVLHLQLQLPKELMGFPWELMHDGRHYLGERYALGRQVFMATGLSRRVPRRKARSVKVLIVGDPQFTKEFQGWPQLPGAREEAKELADLFERLGEQVKGAIDFDRPRDLHLQEHVSTFQMREWLRSGEYDIIHFAGHAQFREDKPELSAWMCSDGPLWALEIRNTLAQCDFPPWLVFANACEAGDGADSNCYQSNVFGLATAFLNEGVTAYIGPLWPINDAVALQMATDFYGELLLERASLGEALRFAKQRAKLATMGNHPSEMQTGMLAGLSWASQVLYGDPTMKLLESLGASAGPEQQPSQQQQKMSRRRRRKLDRRNRVTVTGRPARPVQAPVAMTQRLVCGPMMEPQPLTNKRMAESVPHGKYALELAEVNGVRYWHYFNEQTGAYEPLDGAGIRSQLQTNAALRAQLGANRGILDYPRIIGRWLIGRQEGGLVQSLVEQYDRDKVATEQLLAVDDDGSLSPLSRTRLRWIDGRTSGRSDRVLLIIHGTFSETQSPVDGLGEDFLRWASRNYAAVIGYDHWTLSKTPAENALNLWDKLDDRLKRKNRVDIVTHSRGGLVARALVELIDEADGKVSPAEMVRQIVFVGTPNAGTDLANPKNWGQAADMLVNLMHVDSDGVYGRMSGLLARLVSLGSEALIQRIPGLWAQNPLAISPGDFLGQLQRGGMALGVIYSGVTANYQPGGEVNVHRLLQEFGDSSLDAFYGSSNDLVVNTSHVWHLHSLEPATNRLPQGWAKERLLLFNPPGDESDYPPGIQVERRFGVHHTNLFMFDETRDFIKKRLRERLR